MCRHGESDIRKDSFEGSSHMTFGEGLSRESFNHVRCGSSEAYAALWRDKAKEVLCNGCGTEFNSKKGLMRHIKEKGC